MEATPEQIREKAACAALKTMPKYTVMVAKNPRLPPGTEGNTVHLSFNWFVHMIWVLMRDHREAAKMGRFQIITYKG